MGGNQKVRISQCMIVKNEEKNIERALSWGRGLMYEQIVVDTGSTDRTVELAERMGAKVLQFEWINDFAAAKNFAIDQARGNWIAFLDADEYFLPEDAKKLPSLLKQLHTSRYLGVISEWLNFNDEGRLCCGGTQIRLFRNLSGLRYRGRIHETLAKDGKQLDGSLMIDASDELAIHHDGYKQSVAGNGEKGKRNRPLIEKELEEHPDSDEMMGYLADCYWTEGADDLAIEWYEKAIAAMDHEYFEYNMRASNTYANLLLLLGKKNESDRLMAVYEIAVKDLPKEADFDYIVGKHWAHKGNYEKGVHHLGRALRVLEQYGDNNRAANLTGDLPGTWELLALCFYYTGELSKCVGCCVNLLKAQKYIMATLVIMLSAFRGTQPAAEVVQFLGRLYDFNSLKDRVFVLKAALKAGCPELSAVLGEMLSPEERESFELAVAGS